MRVIGLVAIGLWLSACTTTPMFPPETMKDVEANTFDDKAWEKEAYQSPSRIFVPHKVELAGEIIRVIQKADGVVILAEQRTLERPLAGTTTSLEQDGAPWFAITFNGPVEPSLLQTGNRLIAVGTTNQARSELFGGAPRLLPHLNAQCLHIWDTEGAKNKYLLSDTGVPEDYPLQERTFCSEENTAGSSITSQQDQP